MAKKTRVSRIKKFMSGKGYLTRAEICAGIKERDENKSNPVGCFLTRATVKGITKARMQTCSITGHRVFAYKLVEKKEAVAKSEPKKREKKAAKEKVKKSVVRKVKKAKVSAKKGVSEEKSAIQLSSEGKKKKASSEEKSAIQLAAEKVKKAKPAKAKPEPKKREKVKARLDTKVTEPAKKTRKEMKGNVWEIMVGIGNS